MYSAVIRSNTVQASCCSNTDGVQYRDSNRNLMIAASYPNRTMLLLQVCGGLTLMFVLYEIYLLRCMWVLAWTWWVLIPLLLFMVSTAIAIRCIQVDVTEVSFC